MPKTKCEWILISQVVTRLSQHSYFCQGYNLNQIQGWGSSWGTLPHTIIAQFEMTSCGFWDASVVKCRHCDIESKKESREIFIKQCINKKQGEMR